MLSPPRLAAGCQTAAAKSSARPAHTTQSTRRRSSLLVWPTETTARSPSSLQRVGTAKRRRLCSPATGTTRAAATRASSASVSTSSPRRPSSRTSPSPAPLVSSALTTSKSSRVALAPAPAPRGRTALTNRRSSRFRVRAATSARPGLAFRFLAKPGHSRMPPVSRRQATARTARRATPAP